jgi:hypothetical protein
MARVQLVAVLCLLALAHSSRANQVPADWCKTSDQTSMAFTSSNGDRVLAALSRQGDHVTGSVMIIRKDGQVTANGFTAGDFNSKILPAGLRYLDLKIHFQSEPGDVEIGALLSYGSGEATAYGFTSADTGVAASTFENCAGWPQAYYLDSTGRAGALPAPRYTCEVGYVWREADAFDRVCVTPQDREATARQNRDSHLYTESGPAGGCKLGYFYRMAIPMDTVCTDFQWGQAAQKQNETSHFVNYEDQKIDVQGQFSYCDNYGVSAAAEAQKNVAMQCGNMGVRWDRSRDIQQNWCRAQMLAVGTDQAMQLAKAESDARQNTLLKCELKNNPGPILKERGPLQPRPPGPLDATRENPRVRVLPVIIPQSARVSEGSSSIELRCLSGFVWREAAANDNVCVAPDSRTRAAEENRTAGTHRAGGNTLNCVPGLVWREAFPNDTVCVTPGRRAEVREENRSATQRQIRH